MFCRHFLLILYANDCKHENSFLFYLFGYVNIFWVVTFLFHSCNTKVFFFSFHFFSHAFQLWENNFNKYCRQWVWLCKKQSSSPSTIVSLFCQTILMGDLHSNMLQNCHFGSVQATFSVMLTCKESQLSSLCSFFQGSIDNINTKVYNYMSVQSTLPYFLPFLLWRRWMNSCGVFFF